MHFDQYTPDVICQAMGLPAFVEPGWSPKRLDLDDPALPTRPTCLIGPARSGCRAAACLDIRAGRCCAWPPNPFAERLLPWYTHAIGRSVIAQRRRADNRRGCAIDSRSAQGI